jgi:hypothetical protein
VDRNRAMLQLALVRAVLQGARRRGSLSPEMRERASEIVEMTAIAIEPETDREWAELLAAVRADLGDD